MRCQLISHGSIGPFATIVLENRHIKVVVIPELGGRIWQLEDRVRKREWIWHRDDIPLARVRTDAVYDDVWAGGWEELFPNDAPGLFEGRDLPDHGEWWRLRWNVDKVDDYALRLVADSSVIKATCSKEIHIAGNAARVSVTYRARSMEDQPFHFLFKQHLPVRLTEACRLTLPGGKVQVVDPSFSTLLSRSDPFDWPRVTTDCDRAVDLQLVLPRETGEKEFVYVTDLPQPWCGVDDLDCHASLRMEFESRFFPYVWLFLSYGGWRDTYTAVLEPCTNMPKDLGEAARRRQSANLRPGEEFLTTVCVALSAYTPTSCQLL